MKKIIYFVKKYKIAYSLIVVLLVVYYFSLPKKIFDSPTSTVVTASNNELLGAVIAKDGQWRFPEIDSIPIKFKHCILQFEDAYFYKHFGFNPVSIAKAIGSNFSAKKIVRGGSTLTQQVIRLSRKNKKRSYLEKLKELILATRLEFRFSKEEILKLYASHAPFGGNVVGLEMAAWRYYKLKPHQLSWAETATLAVLPNAPSLIYPGKNQYKLKEKRNRLLRKLFKQQILDSITYELALLEELPQKPYKLPSKSNHFIQKVAKDFKGERVKSSLDIFLQEKVYEIVKQKHTVLKQNEVHNAAVLVLDVTTKKVLAYIGNTPTDKEHQKDVDNIIAPRSTGSILKPFLYAHMLASGELLPEQLLPDVPTDIAGYTPKNFDLTFDGAVPANEALTRSLNIPAVKMLQRYGVSKFKDDLKDYKLEAINKSADYYGLSLILGGAESSLWDLCNVFSGYANTVNNYELLHHNYYQQEFTKASYLFDEKITLGLVQKMPQILDAGAIYTTLQTLTEVNRPTTDQAWKFYDSSQKIAWKTGTSFGNRDAWAIGVTANYAVGVWVGNSDGEGRTNLTGVGSASPIMFSVFDVLPKSDWFVEPVEDLIEEKICIHSGCLALPICTSEVKRIPKKGVEATTCKYHKEVQLDKKQQYRVNSSCESVSNFITKSWFVLPPLQAYYYQQKNADYKVLPNYRVDCEVEEVEKMDFVFPTQYYSKIALTKGEEGAINSLVLKLTHTFSDSKVYWYLNNSYLNVTEGFHELAIKPKKGIHTITVIDDLGNELKRVLEVY